MSGVDGALMGEAIMSDGDVLALTIEQGPQGKTRVRSYCSPHLQQAWSAEPARPRRAASLPTAPERGQ